MTTSPFASNHSEGLPELLAELSCSLALTTYQAGKVIFISSDGTSLHHLPRTPMGLAIKDHRMALATKDRLVLLTNEPRLAQNYPQKPD